MAERLRYIPELIDVHAEDLAFLLGQRRKALQSPRHSSAQYLDLNERIEAHLQGLSIPPPAEIAARLGPWLASADRDEVCASALAMLRQADPAVEQALLTRFANAVGPRLLGLRDALSACLTDSRQDAMQHLMRLGPPPLASSAAVVLANHGWLDPAALRLDELLLDADAGVAGLAWRAASRADVAARIDDPSRLPFDRPFAAALAHESPALRSSAWEALVWSGRPGAVDALRGAVQRGDAAAAAWLAIVGDEDDAPLIQQAALSTGDPEARCALIARYGHPSGLNALVRWMDPGNVALAVAAGQAFRRITGVDVNGQRVTMPVPDDADEFTREMAPLVWLPDATQAHSLMLLHGPDWFEGTRWCEGRRLDQGLDREQFRMLDMEARWDVAARAAADGQPVSTPCPIH